MKMVRHEEKRILELMEQMSSGEYLKVRARRELHELEEHERATEVLEQLLEREREAARKNHARLGELARDAHSVARHEVASTLRALQLHYCETCADFFPAQEMKFFFDGEPYRPDENSNLKWHVRVHAFCVACITTQDLQSAPEVAVDLNQLVEWICPESGRKLQARAILPLEKVIETFEAAVEVIVKLRKIEDNLRPLTPREVSAKVCGNE